MSKLSGIFETFPNIDQVGIEQVLNGLKSHPGEIAVENFLANRILYPQAVPVNPEDLDIDWAILREAVKTAPSKFYDQQNKKISVPKDFLARFPDLKRLAVCFIESLNLKDIVHFVGLGTFISCKFEDTKGKMELDIESLRVSVSFGRLMQIPCFTSHCHVSFKGKGVKIAGKQEGVIEALGGKLGVLVDGRKK